MMGITKYGVWVFFKDKKSAEKTSKELNSLMNSYGICIMDKLKVLKDNSFKFYVARKEIAQEVSWKFINTKYVMLDLGKGWELDISAEGLWDEGEEELRKIKNKRKGDKK